MAPTPSRLPQALRSLRRDRREGKVAGVCAGLGRSLGVDPLLLRIAFAAATLASGVGALAYALAWIMLPADEPAQVLRSGRTTADRRASVEIAFGVGFLLLATLLGFRKLGLPFSDVVIWPLALAAAGGALLWSRWPGGASNAPPDAVGPDPASAQLSAPSAPAEVLSPAGRESRRAVISRVGIGVTLVVAAAIVFLQLSGALAAATDAALAAIVVAIALGVIFAPLVARLATSLSAERAERIRSQERAEVAAHLHDSVLQTLALVQKRAGDPRAVATLARRQERELRSWLSGASARDADQRRLVDALQRAAEEIEQERGVAVDVVAVGDAELDRDGEALVAATREAILNAAKFGAGEPVSVYAEVDDERLQVFVRDRGPGFDPAAVPADRRGVRESIIGRMERHGGSVAISASPGGGTEVELLLQRSSS